MIDLPTLLAAIAIVESNTNDLAIGKAGERSRYQIMEYVWYEHTELDFKRFANNNSISSHIASSHISRCIIPALSRAERKTTVYNISACWNAGCTGFIKHNRGHNYANKVIKAYESVDKTNWSKRQRTIPSPNSRRKEAVKR